MSKNHNLTTISLRFKTSSAWSEASGAIVDTFGLKSAKAVATPSAKVSSEHGEQGLHLPAVLYQFWSKQIPARTCCSIVHD